MIIYRIPLQGLKFSTNKIYAGIHWAKRKAIKDSCLDYARAFCRPIQEFGPYPIEIRYRFIFASRALDTTNCTFLVKMFEDSFRALGILKDDNPKYVVRTIIEVATISKCSSKDKFNELGGSRNKKEEDYLEITATPCNYLSISI